MKIITGAAASAGDSVFLVTAHYDERIRIWKIDFAEQSILPEDIITFSTIPLPSLKRLKRGGRYLYSM
jgi:hypothetical protein